MKINNKLIFVLIIIITITAIIFKIYSDKNDEANIDNNTNLEERNNIYENVNMEISNVQKEDEEAKENLEKGKENIITVTEENFEESVIKSDKIVIVDFWASWCTPCTYMSPILEEIAEENEDVILGKVNVDEEEALSIKYQVTRIPTMIIFKNGKEEKQIIGIASKEKILEYINEIK